MTNWKHSVRAIGATVLLAFAVLAAGCATRGAAPGARRVARYRPDVAGGPQGLPVEAGAEAPAEEFFTRTLRPGDRVHIYLRGIPTPEEIEDEIDPQGMVSLPLIGAVRIGGLTTSEAEAAIERAYIEGEIYRSITVIVVAPEEEYFVRGEVKAPGQYALIGDRTLMRAIAAAGGYTPYANAKRVRLIRGGESREYNIRDIEAGKAEDPAIEPGDVIIVPESIF